MASPTVRERLLKYKDLICDRLDELEETSYIFFMLLKLVQCNGAYPCAFTNAWCLFKRNIDTESENPRAIVFSDLFNFKSLRSFLDGKEEPIVSGELLAFQNLVEFLENMTDTAAKILHAKRDQTPMKETTWSAIIATHVLKPLSTSQRMITLDCGYYDKPATCPCSPTCEAKLEYGDNSFGLWQALREVFPLSNLKGCWFHWAKAVQRKVQEVGLQATYQGREGAHLLIRKLLALPFLPGDISRAFLKLRDRADGCSRPLQDLFEYVNNQWITSSLWSTDKWSVYRQPVHTNNDTEWNDEVWHGSLDIIIGDMAYFAVVKPDEEDSSKIDSAFEGNTMRMNECMQQYIAESITLAFLDKGLTPLTVLSQSVVKLFFYDEKTDLLFESSEISLLDENDEFHVTSVLILWFVINYRQFCLGVQSWHVETGFTADFRLLVTGDALQIYEKQMKRGHCRHAKTDIRRIIAKNYRPCLKKLKREKSDSSSDLN